MVSKIDIRTGIIIALIMLAALSRLLPHPHNFTPIGAIALFGAANFSRRWLAFLVPFAGMWFSDLLLNNLVFARQFPELYNGFHWFGSIWVYASFALIVLMGFALLRQVRVSSLLAASLGASVLFFLVTNFGAWLGNPQYPQNFGGLLMSYTLGIPFFWNTLLGDLFFTGVLFGSFYWIQSRLPLAKSFSERQA